MMRQVCDTYKYVYRDDGDRFWIRNCYWDMDFSRDVQKYEMVSCIITKWMSRMLKQFLFYLHSFTNIIV